MQSNPLTWGNNSLHGIASVLLFMPTKLHADSTRHAQIWHVCLEWHWNRSRHSLRTFRSHFWFLVLGFKQWARFLDQETEVQPLGEPSAWLVQSIQLFRMTTMTYDLKVINLCLYLNSDINLSYPHIWVCCSSFLWYWPDKVTVATINAPLVISVVCFFLIIWCRMHVYWWGLAGTMSQSRMGFIMWVEDPKCKLCMKLLKAFWLSRAYANS